MPLERFSGSDIPSLLARARQAIGSDAVLVSTRRLRGGEHSFEIVAADPDTARHAGRATPPSPSAPAARSVTPVAAPIAARPASPFEIRRPPARPALATPGDSVRVHTPVFPHGAALSPDASLIDPRPRISNPIRRRHRDPAVIALVGPTGAGKTTTIAKLATHPHVFAGHSIGLVCLDTYRIGAVEQLRTYADIAKLPLEVIYEVGDAGAALRRLRDCEILLVDTAGRGPAATADLDATWEQLRRLAPAEVHLVLPAGLRPDLARRIALEHRDRGITHLLGTKLDEDADDGVFELAADTGLPMRWYTDGQEVPFHLKPAAPRLKSAGHPACVGALEEMHTG